MFDVVFTDQPIKDYRDTLKGDKALATRFNQLLRARGIMKGESKYYVSLAHTRADIDHTIGAWTDAIGGAQALAWRPRRRGAGRFSSSCGSAGVAYSWLSCGLIGDGSYYLLDAVTVGPYKDVGHERAVPNLLAQLPLAAAIAAGVTDLHWLARLQSLGWFALPAILYSLAVLRTRRDPLHQACVVVAIAIVFMTSSFLIVAEHVTAYAIATMTAAWIVTARRLQVGDGVVLLVLAAMSTLSHEVFVYLGPLLAAMTVWAVRRAPIRSSVAVATYLAAAVVFVVSAVLAWRSSRHSRTRPISRRRHPKPGISGRIRLSISLPLLPSSSRALPWCGRPISRPRVPGFSSLLYCSRWCCCRCLS